MRIIFANGFAFVTAAFLAVPAFASDLFYEPERIRRVLMRALRFLTLNMRTIAALHLPFPA
jgi:hypothetical protein